MTDNVLFLAEGGTRKRAAVVDAARVVENGGRATIVVRDSPAWANERIGHGIRLIDLDQIEARRSWMPVERVLLERGPQFVFRIVGLGPVKGWSGRAARAWRRRIATPLHQRTFLPLLRRSPAARPPALIRQGLGSFAAIDLLVITDPASMPTAAAFVELYDPPRVAYNLDHAAPAASMGER